VLTENLTSSIASANNPEQQQDGNAAMDVEEEYEVPDSIEEIIGN